MRRWAAIGLLLSIAALPGCARQSAPPDVILLTVDTLRWDRTVPDRYPRALAPSFQRFAREAVVFDDAHATAASTLPSLTSLMTGLWPFEAGVTWNGHRLGPELVTLAERLAARGYRTVAVVSNPMLEQGSGMAQGFSVYDAHFTVKERNRDVAERPAAATLAAALATLEGSDARPLFLWVHWNDPHGPYLPDRIPFSDAPPGTDGEARLPVGSDDSGLGAIPRYQELAGVDAVGDYVNRYDGEVAQADAAIGRLLDRLRGDADRWRRALVVLAADHGEALGEHGYYFAHGHAVYEELIHVPLLIKFPAGGPAPGTRNDRVSLVDVAATVAEVVGLDGEVAGRGRSLVAPGGDAEVFAMTSKGESARPGQCLIVGAVKLLRFDDGEEQLTHVEDGRESAMAPDTTLRRDLDARLEAARASAPAPEPLRRDLDAELREQMRALGYVDSSR